jgi:drug/metabolite transporter (DMT)-like permease
MAAWLVYFRLPTHVSWSIARKKNRLLRVVLDSLATGLVLVLIHQLNPGGGEPSVTPALANRLIWFAVVSGAGAANPLLLYGGSSNLNTKFTSTRRASR